MPDSADQRAEMVRRQLRSRDITDRNVLNAFAAVRREAFVPDRMKPYAYDDRPLPIGAEQTISQPYIVALMLQYLDIEKDAKVLEIGTGSGYQTALLAEICTEVWTVERIETLYRTAKEVLDGLGYDNIHYRLGDGRDGWPEEAPFDRIVVSASTADVPQALEDQLAEGGKLLIPVGPQGHQMLTLIERRGGQIHRNPLESCVFVPLLGGMRGG